MSTSARVTSVEAMHGFRRTVVEFAELISGAMFSLRSEVFRTQEWIEHECPQYWRAQSRLAYDAIATARSNLETAQMRGKTAGHHPSCYDEQVALRKAKQRLQFTQDQIENARRWGNKFRREAEEYKGILGKLQHVLDHDLIMLQSTLDGMLRSLEAYLEGMPVDSSANAGATRDERSTSAAENAGETSAGNVDDRRAEDDETISSDEPGPETSTES